MSKLLTVKEVADYLRVTRVCVAQWIKAGKLPSTKLGGCRRILETDLESFISRGRSAQPAPAKAA